MKRPIIKVSGISSLTDARYCAGMEVDYLGIRFDAEGNGSMERNLFASISGWIEGPVWVGEYEGNDPEKLLQLAKEYGIGTWEIESEAMAITLSENGLKVALKWKLNNTEIPEMSHQDLVYIQVECSDITNNVTETFFKRNSSIPILIGPVTSVSQIKKNWIGNSQIGFNLYSGEEERPGWMDLSQLQDLLESLEEV